MLILNIKYSVMTDKQENSNKIISKIDISWASNKEPDIIKKFEKNFKNEYNKYRKAVQNDNNSENKIKTNEPSNINESSINNKNIKNIEDILNEQKSSNPEYASGFSFNATEVN